MTAVLSSDLSAMLAHAANGKNGAGGNTSISDIVAAVMIERLKKLDASITGAANDINSKSTYISNMKIALRELRVNRPKGTVGTVNVSRIKAVGEGGKVFKVVDYIDDGLFPGAVGEEAWNQQQFDEAIEWLNAKINLMSNESQLDMIRLQLLIDRRNELSFKDQTELMNQLSKSINSALLHK
jgi:hypothetical protein